MQSDLLNTSLNQVPPSVLYHYTTPTGFLGIVNTGCLWATHTQYLNDQREYRHAIDRAKESIQAMKVSGRFDDEPIARDSVIKILDDMENGLDGLNEMNVCVCSFSAERDSLSQWRAYGGSPSGFSLGFSGDFIKQTAIRNEWFLAPCIYDEKEQTTLIAALVNTVFRQNINNVLNGTVDPHMPPGGNLNAWLHRYAPMIKHESFKEEKEWRLISRPLSCRNKLFDFRSGNSMLLPYYKYPLAAEGRPIEMSEVIIGPTPNPYESRRSTESFLVKHHIKASMENSSIPYRNW